MSVVTDNDICIFKTSAVLSVHYYDLLEIVVIKLLGYKCTCNGYFKKISVFLTLVAIMSVMIWERSKNRDYAVTK